MCCVKQYNEYVKYVASLFVLFFTERETPFLLQQFPCLFIFIWDMRKWDKDRDLCSG